MRFEKTFNVEAEDLPDRSLTYDASSSSDVCTSGTDHNSRWYSNICHDDTRISALLFSDYTFSQLKYLATTPKKQTTRSEKPHVKLPKSTFSEQWPLEYEIHDLSKTLCHEIMPQYARPFHVKLKIQRNTSNPSLVRDVTRKDQRRWLQKDTFVFFADDTLNQNILDVSIPENSNSFKKKRTLFDHIMVMDDPFWSQERRDSDEICPIESSNEQLSRSIDTSFQSDSESSPIRKDEKNAIWFLTRDSFSRKSCSESKTDDDLLKVQVQSV